MATWHLDELRAAIERRGWRCTEIPGDDYKVSATWELRRAGDGRVLHVDFEGLDDLRVLPLAESYGCKLRESDDLGLHFRRQRARKLWEAELRAFVESLEP